MYAATVTDLVMAGKRIRQPDVIWFQLWDNSPNPQNPYIPNMRNAYPYGYVKMYAENETQTHGGFTFNVDADAVDISIWPH